MAALINAIDKTSINNPSKYGENSHMEYAWSCDSDFKERILQFNFQLTRCNNDKVREMGIQLNKLLTDLKNNYVGRKITSEEYTEFMNLLYKSIAYTRDVIDGKGEYTLSYMCLFEWYKFHPDYVKHALVQFVRQPCKTNIYTQKWNIGYISEDCLADWANEEESDETVSKHPYGSWKDIKYFCHYCKTNGMNINDPLISFCIELINSQIMIDIAELEYDNKQISLVGKWVPRESSEKFGWLYEELACDYFYHYLESSKNDESKKKAIRKCKTEYRKICSKLNKYLETVQINMCSNNWSDINHSKTTSITISRQKKSFLNVKKDGTQRYDIDDRISCAKNFTDYISKSIEKGVQIKGKRVGLNNMTHQAIELINRINNMSRRSDIDIDTNVEFKTLQTEIAILNSQWNDNSSSTSKLNKMIAMVDLSGSMEGEPLETAIALGCRVSEKSILGNRILSFTSDPTWHNLSNCKSFIEKVEKISSGQVGYDTNFYKALKLILDAIIDHLLPPEEVEDMVLAIFSDMQINEAQKGLDMNSMYKNIERLYSDTGIELWGKPFRPPHILFWNLRNTDGFPCLSSQKNVSMMSGFSPALLNSFCNLGIEALTECTPYSMLVSQLKNPRYDSFSYKI